MTCFVYRIRQMVSFKLDKEIDEDVFISYFLFFTKLKTYYLSYAIYKIWRYWHCWFQQYIGHVLCMNFVRTLLTIESLWLSGRASEHGIWRTEVRFLMGTQNFSLSHTCAKTKKNLFPNKMFISSIVYHYIECSDSAYLVSITSSKCLLHFFCEHISKKHNSLQH